MVVDGRRGLHRREIGIRDDTGPQRRGCSGEPARRCVGARGHRWRRRCHRAAREQQHEHRAHHIAIAQLPALRCAACMRSSDWIAPASAPENTSFAP